MKKKLKTILSIFFFLCFLRFEASGAVSIGDNSATVEVKVFSSLTCPHCANFHLNIFENLKKDYIDSGKVMFKHFSFPLDLAALNAEKILRCTPDKNLSFKMMDEIYKKQNFWAVGSDIKKINKLLIEVVENFGLTKKDLQLCLQDEKLQDKILEERINAQKKYKITSTPTIFINEKKYEKDQNYKTFKKEIDKNL